MKPKILVVYYSATGNVARLAHGLAKGAADTGADVRIRRVAETAPLEAIASNPRWSDYLSRDDLDEIASLDDVVWADGMAIGSPTRFGGPASQLKAFLDTTGGLWMQGALLTKVCTAFTSASTGHGGVESTVLAINNHCYHWGTLIMPLGYPDSHILKVTGNPYGSSFIARSGSTPDEDSLTAAHTQGARLATIVGDLLRGRRESEMT
ncbi:MAG: NAD(P)H:quinone oxidoreductase [Actinomycetota bacterium]|nr:NAD(P)H:quinone oxidoreductase [Actinomycetota bacterium]